MQPVVWDGHGVTRFLANPIVRFLVDWGRDHGMSLNDLHVVGMQAGWTRHDWQHFSQLHGYSVSGWFDLSYANKAERDEADRLEAELVRRQPSDPKKRRRASSTRSEPR